MQEEVNIRRAPKLLPFGLTGSLLGAVLGVLVYFLVPDTDASPENALGLFLVYGAGTFGAFGVIFAIVLDWITVRKTKKVIAERSEQTPDNDKVGE
jgi:TRAP-type C4-dicarboxylate transport system permease small subunit